MRRVDIRAPVEGTITNLLAHTVGGVIEPAAVIMSVVPDDETLVVEAQVSPSAIDQLRPGQPARVRLSAFNLRTTPEIDAEVTTVAADRVYDESSNSSYYAITVLMDAEELAELEEPLVPGMPAEVFLVTGNRTPMSYLTKPLADQFARSMRDD